MPGTINVIKQTQPATNNVSFDFVLSGNQINYSFTLNHDGTESITNLEAGATYQLVETLPAGWMQTAASCSDNSSIDAIALDENESVTCTITNAQLGRLIIRKVTIPNPDLTGADFSFTTGGGLTPGNFTLRNGQSFEFPNLQPRSGYSVSETLLDNWQISDASCDNSSSVHNIRIDPGQTVTCTFYNMATLTALTLDKDDGSITAEPGDTIVYSLKYRNIGNKNARDVVITEQVPEHTTFAGPAEYWSCALGAPAETPCLATIDTLVGGSGEGEVSFSVTVDSLLPANATQIENRAQITHSGDNTVVESSEITPLEANGGLRISKDDGGISAKAGGVITYTLAYSNERAQAALGVVISETVPLHTTFIGPSNQWSCPVGSLAGVTCRHTVGLLAGMGRSTVPFQVKVAASLPVDLNEITNRAVIGGLLNPNADVGTDRTAITISPDLTLGLSDSNITVAPGENLRYRLSYANISARAAAGVYLTATLPPHSRFNGGESSNGWQCNGAICTYNVGNLASGGGNAIDFAITVERPLPAGTTALTLNARIDDNGQNGSDPTPQNNVATETTPVAAPLVLRTTKRDALVIDANLDGKVGPGDTIEYTILLSNDGDLGLRQLVLTDDITAPARLVAGVTSSQGTVSKGNDATDQQVVVNVGDIAGGGGSATIRFRVVIDKPLAAGVTIVQNQAVVSSPDFADRRTDDPDSAAVNDPTQTTLDATVQLRADLNDFLFIDADSNLAVTVGDTLIYQLGLQNIGDVDTGPLAIVIPLDTNVTLVAGSVNSSRGTIVDGNNDAEDILINVDNVAAGVTVLVSFQVTLVVANGDAIRHQSGIHFQDGNGERSISSDDPATATAGDMTITLVGDKPPLRPFFLPLISR